MSGSPRLLLIDDEPALADYLASAAKLAAFEPEIASDHEDFRRRFREDPPAMVAVDLGMPGADGVELLRFLASENAEQPVLIISGFDNRIVDTAYRLGRELGLNMVGPMNKPARLEALEHLFGQVRQRLVA
ncbi:response regulator [Sphingomicrobium sediminis]|uniref:Response regulator n=1 Tax=Sphingomicrobium sediminis TaxID=2950949 RepID=A0A9X2EH51_9SPHN|nr:response regulator [Sphingomicrobium sediminis]MCM8556576.1 response regulator [Sphingomicrobium sediminis]